MWPTSQSSTSSLPPSAPATTPATAPSAPRLCKACTPMPMYSSRPSTPPLPTGRTLPTTASWPSSLGKLSTQILGALQSLPLPQQTIDDFEALVKKFRSRPKKSAKTKASGSANDATERVVGLDPALDLPRTISTSQQSFDQKLQHVEKMILTLQGIPSYAPNESIFQVANLQARLATLHALNDAANASYSALRQARTDRNAFFYGPNTGLLDLVKYAKAYIKSIYGASSPQYRASNDIRFVRVRVR